MNRTEFVFAIAIILFLAFCLGWLAHWIVQRFSKVSAADMSELDELASQLHAAEETRDQAMAYLQQREAELTNQITQTEAELSAAMEGLRDARSESEELRAYIERVSQPEVVSVEESEANLAEEAADEPVLAEDAEPASADEAAFDVEDGKAAAER